MIAVGCAALLLLLGHLLPASPRLRDAIVGRIGERAYLAGYSVLAVLASAALILTYRDAPRCVLWSAPGAVKLAVAPLMVLALVFVCAGLTTPNPTIVGAAGAFARPGIVRGILRVTRHPFLWGMGLWALGHVVATGDLASIVAFGAVALLGLGGTLVLDAKKARTHPAQWTAFASATSNLPFAAIVGGRQRLALGEIGGWRLGAAAVLLSAALLGHRWAFGVSPLPGAAPVVQSAAPHWSTPADREGKP